MKGKSKATVVEWKESHCGSDRTVTLKTLDEELVALHENTLRDKLCAETDMFVLYNPGIGATKVLSRSWRDTLKLLVKSGKPVLCTALGYEDMERDLKMISEWHGDGLLQSAGNSTIPGYSLLIPPDINAFSSQRRSLALTDPDQPVQTTNMYTYAFCGKVRR